MNSLDLRSSFRYLTRGLTMAGLNGETVNVTVTYTTTTSSGQAINGTLYTGSLIVTSGVELSNQAVSYSYVDGYGFTQTISGTISIDVTDSGYMISFAGTQQPGGINYRFSSLNDESVPSIASATETGSSGT